MKVAVTLPSGPTLGLGRGVTSAVSVTEVMNAMLTMLYAGNPVPLTATSDPGFPLRGDKLMAWGLVGATVGVGVGDAITENVVPAPIPPAQRATRAVPGKPVGTMNMAVTSPFQLTTGVGKDVTSTIPMKDLANSILAMLYAGNPFPLTTTLDPTSPLPGDTVMVEARTVKVASTVLPVVSEAVTLLETATAVLGTMISELKVPAEETAVVRVVPQNVMAADSVGTKLVPFTVNLEPIWPFDRVSLIFALGMVQVVLLVTPVLSVIATYFSPPVTAGTLQIAVSLPPLSMPPTMSVAATPPNVMDAMVTLPAVFGVKPRPSIMTMLWGSPLLGVIVGGNVAALADVAPAATGLHTKASISSRQATR